MLSRIRTFLKYKNRSINKIPEIWELIDKRLDNDLKSPKVNLGQIQSSLNNQRASVDNLADVEFQVFSQWGDDGIIQYLVNKLQIPNKTFIEFGVENYRESNTRFLLINNNWTGYVIDGSAANVNYIKNDLVYWACELHAEAAFITRENINELLKKPGFDPEVGILSIDIDGNDYYIFKEINCLNPVIIIAEYNSIFGKNTAWTVPYDPAFVRHEKHSSNIYYGASLKALYNVAKEKGYTFVGCNSKGNNAYFIRNDKMVSAIPVKTIEQGFVESKFREALVNGKRISGKDRIKLLKGLDIYDAESNSVYKIDPAVVQY